MAQAIVNAIDKTGNESKIYEIGGKKIISFGDLVKSILRAIGKKKIVMNIPIPLGKILGSMLQLLPGKPLLTKDQCLILSEKHNIVSNNHLTIQDLGIIPVDVESKMSSWLVKYREAGQFTKI